MTGGEHLADSFDQVALVGSDGEELKTMTEAIVKANQSANLQRFRGEGKREFESNYFVGFEGSGQSYADAVHPQFCRSTPDGDSLSFTENMSGYSKIDRKALKFPP